MNSSETSAKYSCPIREQKLEIHDSGTPEEEDMSSSDCARVVGVKDATKVAKIGSGRDGENGILRTQNEEWRETIDEQPRVRAQWNWCRVSGCRPHHLQILSR